MAVLFRNHYYTADRYTVSNGVATFIYKGTTILSAPINELKLFQWSLS